MATETVYIQYEEAVLIHFSLMRKLGETRYGVDHRDLIESALAVESDNWKVDEIENWLRKRVAKTIY